MPPAAQFDFVAALEEPYTSIEDVGGIEVEAVHGLDNLRVVTRIRLLPRDPLSDEYRHSRNFLSTSALEESRFEYFDASKGKCLADSFDSFDEIEEDSNEARLLKSLAAKAAVIPYNLESGLGEPMLDYNGGTHEAYFLDEHEAKYLDVLDRHLEDTEAESMSFSGLESGPDGPHPAKTMANMDQIMEHLLDNPCCECSPTRMARPLKSSLRPSRWTYRNGDRIVLGTRRAQSSDLSVQFKEVDIREFKMTLGNHPSATSGPPVMLDWQTNSSESLMDIASYEKSRQPRRNRRQLKLSLQQRHNILVKERGFSFEEVRGAWQEALEIRKKRKETLERGLALMKWDEVWESTCRKFARIVDGT